MDKINVKNLLVSEVGTQRTFDINESIKAIGLPTEIEGKKVVGKAKAIRLEDTILIEGEFVAGTVLICDRCLENFKAHIPFILEREYNLNRSKESPDELFIDKLGDIDLTEAMREEIILAIPMKNICEEKCKGICAKCGVDLNKEECKCKNKKKRSK